MKWDFWRRQPLARAKRRSKTSLAHLLAQSALPPPRSTLFTATVRVMNFSLMARILILDSTIYAAQFVIAEKIVMNSTILGCAGIYLSTWTVVSSISHLQHGGINFKDDDGRSKGGRESQNL